MERTAKRASVVGEVRRLVSEGMCMKDALGSAGVSETTYRRWAAKLDQGGIAALADALRAAQRRLGKRGMDRFDNLKRRIRALIADARKDYERLTAAAESAKAAAEAELAPLRAEIRRLQAA